MTCRVRERRRLFGPVDRTQRSSGMRCLLARAGDAAVDAISIRCSPFSNTAPPCGAQLLRIQLFRWRCHRADTQLAICRRPTSDPGASASSEVCVADPRCASDLSEEPRTSKSVDPEPRRHRLRASSPRKWTVLVPRSHVDPGRLGAGLVSGCRGSEWPLDDAVGRGRVCCLVGVRIVVAVAVTSLPRRVTSFNTIPMCRAPTWASCSTPRRSCLFVVVPAATISKVVSVNRDRSTGSVTGNSGELSTRTMSKRFVQLDRRSPRNFGLLKSSAGFGGTGPHPSTVNPGMSGTGCSASSSVNSSDHHRCQANALVEPEEGRQSRPTKVGRHQDDVLAHRGQDDPQVRDRRGLAFGGCGACDEHRSDRVVIGRELQRRAQGPVGLGRRRRGFSPHRRGRARHDLARTRSWARGPSPGRLGATCSRSSSSGWRRPGSRR